LLLEKGKAMVSKLTNNVAYQSNFKTVSLNTAESKVSSANNVEKVDKIQSLKEKIASGDYVLDMSKTAKAVADGLF
jgi:anti-sigma28 factor (negative regulator of flagellin synthesis)